MPTIASGANATITVAAGQILTVQSDGATFDYENPVGTRVGEYACDTVFGPFTAAGSVKLTSVQGPLFYELGTAQRSNTQFDPSNVAITGGVIGGVPIRAYTGIVGSRAGFYSDIAAANKQSMSRSKHVAMEDISSLQLVYGNFYVKLPSPFEYTPGASATFTASIEYPVGTLTVVKFGGSNSGVVADGGTLLSDPVAVSIPRGAAFYVRSWQNNSAGILYNKEYGLNNVSGSVPNSGEWWTFGVTTPDLTQSTTNSNNQQTAIHFRPTAIIGATKRPAFFLAGDSRMGQGVSYDTAPNSYGGRGEVERSLVRSFATINAGASGEKLSEAVAGNYSKRLAFAQYCSHVICEYGINDFSAGTSVATHLANLATFAGFFGGKPVYQTTISPKSASTDSWATTANQTTDATANPLRVSFNNAVRAGLAAPIVGCIEIADQVESARDSGLWKVTGSANGYTADGLHGNAAGNALIEVSTAFQSVIAG